jgi:signal transduction histidine kinase
VGTSVNISIQPPFWETWWFRSVTVLVLVGIAFGGYRMRVRNLESRSRELEQQVQERTTELSAANVLLEQEMVERERAEEALSQERAEAAVMAERNRLARDLHDSVTQSIYSLTLFAEATRHVAEEKGSEIIERQVDQIGHIAQQALKEMRLLVFELRPPELEREGLVRALRRRLEAVEGRAGVEGRVVVDVAGEGSLGERGGDSTRDFGELPENIEENLYRIAQEALNNTLKHASASSVVVYLRRRGSQIELEVIDDGLGFDPESTRDKEGMGLESIRERAQELGGAAVIRSAPGEGVSVKVIVAI